MPSDYKKICQDNIRRRGEEFDDIGHLIAEQLYSKKSHFIYELLQNAEDALERRCRQDSGADFPGQVQFSLFPDRLEFRHFGELFNEEDVRGISDVLKGTKSQDSKQIGKFGIGFKSVYAFTASPEIHSGEEHFVIKRYIRPEAKLPDTDVSIKPGETVFIFPFDHKDFSREDAFNLILDKLRTLGPRVLLFLRRINEIKWRVELDGEEGHYLREARKLNRYQTAHRVTVIGRKNGQDEDENWLLFERLVTVPDGNGEVPVEIGFRIEAKTEDRVESVVKINDTSLVVYFPTEEETRLGFLVQGPYRTTPARDNIRKDDDWNKTLIKETAELVVESLQRLKEMDLLSVSLLDALPIRAEDFQEGSMFCPIFSRVKEALLSEELLPADDGTFVAASNAKLAGGGELRRLLNQDQLRVLSEELPPDDDETFIAALNKRLSEPDGQVKWLTGAITKERPPDLYSYLMKQLDVEEIDSNKFARKLSGEFLSKQTDEWFISFYKFLLGQKALWQRRWSVLRNKPILRLQEGAHVTPFKSKGNSSTTIVLRRDGTRVDLPNAYLAVEADAETSLPIVKVTLSSDEEARKFLQELGVPELDIVEEVIEKILPKYMDDSVTVDPEENEHDLKTIERAYKTDSAEKKNRLRKELFETPFILSKFQNGERRYCRPNQVYFETYELSLYFSGNDLYGFVDLRYPESVRILLENLGVTNSVRIRKRGKDTRGHVVIANSRGRHVRGIDGFDPDIEVDGLENSIEHSSVEKSVFIWNEIATPHSDCVCGTVESSGRQTYENSWKNERVSENFGRLLIDNAWLPNSDGHLHKPSELTLDDLPESFIRDEKLADQLEMKKNVVAKLLEEANISETILIVQSRLKTPHLKFNNR